MVFHQSSSFEQCFLKYLRLQYLTLCALEEYAMQLTSQQTRHLRSLAHHLKPVVMIGEKGLTENVLAEIDRALNDHELIKISIAGEREERQELSATLCEASNAALVQLIGRITVLYRPAKKPKLVLPS